MAGCPTVSESIGLGKAPKFAFLASSQVMLMLLTRDVGLRTTASEEISLTVALEDLSLNLDSVITTYTILGK